MTRTIPVENDRDALEALDLLVKTGLYRNRSEAIRDLTKRGLDSEEGLKRLGRLVKLLGELDSRKKLDFRGLSLDGEPKQYTPMRAPVQQEY